MQHSTSDSLDRALLLGLHLTVSVGDQHVANRTPNFAAQGTVVAVGRALRKTMLSGWVVHFGPDSTGESVVSGGGAILVLCGELYNRQELELAAGGDKGCSDAQLALACFRRYGVHAFRLLNGRFAALVLTGESTITVTDHAASIPLYFEGHQGGLSVSTERKNLGANARRVPAGTALTHGQNSRAAGSTRTWLPPENRHSPGEADALCLVRSVMETSVEQRIKRSSAKPTTVLSGGIDSSAVTALACNIGRGVETVAMGTNLGNEFDAAQIVVDHLASRHEGIRHTQIDIDMSDLLRDLPWAIWTAEIVDADTIEYLLPLVALYKRLRGGPRRILTGYGADIPLGGMHRDTDDLRSVEDAIACDMVSFDGLNELSPTLSSFAGHWTTHPYWDREVLETLVSLEVGLKRRHSQDKWVLRQSMCDILPVSTINRPKLGVHEGSGISAAFEAELRERMVEPSEMGIAKNAVMRRIYALVIDGGHHPSEVDLSELLDSRPWGASR